LSVEKHVIEQFNVLEIEEFEDVDCEMRHVLEKGLLHLLLYRECLTCLLEGLILISDIFSLHNLNQKAVFPIFTAVANSIACSASRIIRTSIKLQPFLRSVLIE
jgi:hypothetical protein